MMTLQEAEARDAADPLKSYRALFDLPAELIYLDGNSLAPLPRATPERLQGVVSEEWGKGLVGSWNHAGWWEAPIRIGNKIAPLLGARPGEVVATDTTSANLFKLVMAAAALKPGAILAERDNFPTDAHIASEAARLLGRPFRLVDGADLADALATDVSVAIVTHVNYRTAARADMVKLNAAADRSGVTMIWDLSHSIGAVPLDLPRDGTRLAVGCSYKYLNGGPGAPAWLYVASDLQGDLRTPIAGWWGHAAPFAFEAEYRPADGIARFLSGTQPMLSLLSAEVGIDLMQSVDMVAVWEKSIALFELFADRMAALCPELTLVTPRDPAKRGSHISFQHEGAYGIIQALIERGVVGDYRAPGIARFGLTPLYLGFGDIWRASAILADVVRSEVWKDPRFATSRTVT
jgi:kynureninase